VDKDIKKIFVHGWATDSRVWSGLIEEGDITVELPSHGPNIGMATEGSTPDITPATSAIKAALSHLPEGEEVVAIGWSLGAKALMSLAADDPKRFRALVLVGASPSFIKREGFPHGLSKALVRRMLIDFKGSPEETLKRFYRLNFTSTELESKEARAFLELYETTPADFDLKGIATALQSLINVDIRAKLDKIKIPTLLIHGDRDEVTPVEAADYLCAKLKDAELVKFPGAGHAPFITEPEKFTDAVREFLKRI